MTEPEVRAELAATQTVDLTTYGRKSGSPSRIEIWWFHVEDRFIITGTPGKRDWFANVLADPRVIVHTGSGDFAGRATPVEDLQFRRSVFVHPDIGWYQTQSDLDALVATAPMIEVEIE